MGKFGLEVACIGFEAGNAAKAWSLHGACGEEHSDEFGQYGRNLCQLKGVNGQDLSGGDASLYLATSYYYSPKSEESERLFSISSKSLNKSAIVLNKY
jgi:hypothetical protein